ncbi:MAG: hypothetical protein HY835_06500 [Anaerolineae bacterium]|nr:hypothetical protein [Anaerolineae bacterium]
MSIINPFSVTIVFVLVLIGLAVFRPAVGRVVCGVFFLIMALGVNVPVTLIDPTLFAQAGAHAVLPVYRWFFTEVLARYPLPFVIALILFETTVGVLILSRGKGVRLGLLGAVLFCLFLTPVGVEEFTAPLLAIPYALLMRKDFPQPVLRLSRAAG